MSLRLKSCLSAIVFLAIGVVRVDLIPAPKLPSGEQGRFFPQLVRLSDRDSEEIESLLLNRLNRPDLAKHFRKKRVVPELPRDPAVIRALLEAQSERVREWTLRTLGQTAGENSAAIPQLLKILSDAKEDDSTRALVAHVLSSRKMEAPVVAAFVEQLENQTEDLKILLLELLGRAGSAASDFAPELRRYLSAPEGSVQFYAFRAIQQIERPGPPLVRARTHYEMAQQSYVSFNSRAASTDPLKSSLAVLSDSTAPKYLICLGLLNLSTTASGPQPVEAVLQLVGHADKFISELAVNVLDAFPAFKSAEIEILSRGLSHPNANVRLHSALSLRNSGPQALTVLPGLITCLERASTHGASSQEVGACLDVLRPLGTNTVSASSVLLSLLNERSPVYRDLAKHDVDHLRGFLLATLAEIGPSEQALPIVVGSLANAEGWMTLEFAGAARAAAALGPQAAEAVPLLLRPFENDMTEQPISFEKFDAHFSSTREYTTCQAEALRALRRIGSPAHTAAASVRRFLQKALPTIAGPNLAMKLPDLRTEAAATLAAIEPQQP